MNGNVYRACKGTRKHGADISTDTRRSTYGEHSTTGDFSEINSDRLFDKTKNNELENSLIEKYKERLARERNTEDEEIPLTSAGSGKSFYVKSDFEENGIENDFDSFVDFADYIISEKKKKRKKHGIIIAAVSAITAILLVGGAAAISKNRKSGKSPKAKKSAKAVSRKKNRRGKNGKADA